MPETTHDTGFVRLNDPVAYGDPDDPDEKMLRKARENLDIDGLDDEWLDLAVEDIPAEGGDEIQARVVRLYTLLVDSEDRPAADRITNRATEGDGRHSLEGGPDCTFDGYWSHIQESWTFEGIVYNGD